MTAEPGISGSQAASLARQVVAPVAIMALLAWTMALASGKTFGLAVFYTAHQDRWLLTASTVILLIACIFGHSRHKPLRLPDSMLLLLIFVAACVALAGHFLVLSGQDVSRDEQMASFDAMIFASGHLTTPLPPLWRDHADALNTMFMYPADQRAGWVSSYLPVNALVRAVISLFATPYITGGLWILLGGAALWDVCRRIWPTDPQTATIALLLYIGSGQVLVSGMTSYAMPGHLALNLAWLSAHLRRRWLADMVALGIAFAAVGLHQPLMHPLFAAPILFLLLLEKSWHRAAFYTCGYALIGAFWLYWPNFMWHMTQANPLAAQPAGVDFITRLTETVKQNGMEGLPLMEANLLRFFAWQHLLLPALLLLGLPLVRQERMVAALAGGCMLTFVAMLIILPYQGHGFGYRYLHGLIGNAILVAIYGWQAIKRDSDRWRGLIITATVGTVTLVMPMQLAMAHAFYRPWAEASATIDRIEADYVVIGDHDAPFSRDLVLNPPRLDKPPIRLVREAMTKALIGDLCVERPSIALVGTSAIAPITTYFNVRSVSPDQHATTVAANAKLAAQLQRAGCRVTIAP